MCGNFRFPTFHVLLQVYRLQEPADMGVIGLHCRAGECVAEIFDILARPKGTSVRPAINIPPLGVEQRHAPPFGPRLPT